MTYATATGEIVNENAAYTDENGVRYPKNFPREEIPGLIKLATTPYPSGVVVTGVRVEDGVQVWETRPYNEGELEAVRDKALAELERFRRKQEEKGITLSEMPIATDEGSQLKMISERIIAKENPAYSAQWKTKNGPQVVDGPTMIAVADAVRGYVQACFIREGELIQLIKASPDPLSVDITTGWPDTTF